LLEKPDDAERLALEMLKDRERHWAAGGRKPNTERNHMKNLLMKLWREEEGQDLTEYALLIVLVALVAITSMTTLGKAVSDVFANATTNLTAT
jgi:pilus assembly protein Flp/PilA